jgi:hypothetical protein
MFKLYYTTAQGQDVLQPRSDKSLGGYRSASLVKNDDFDNLFGEISNYTLKNSADQSQYVGLILHNDSITGITALNVWFEYPAKCYSKIEIAVIDLSQDADHKYFMENVPSITSSPVYATFHEADGEANKVSIGNMTAGETVGIWLKRTVLKSVADADIAAEIVVDPTNEHRVIFVAPDKSDTIEMKMSHT